MSLSPYSHFLLSTQETVENIPGRIIVRKSGKYPD